MTGRRRPRPTGGPAPGLLVTSGATRRCTATRKDGTPCRALALEGKDVCSFHDRRKAKAFRDGRKLGVRKRLTPRAVTPASEPAPDLSSTEAVVRYLSTLIARVERGQVDGRIGNTVSVLVSNLLRALGAVETLRRIEQLEQAVKAPAGGEGGGVERRAAILDEAVREYEDAIRRVTEPAGMVLHAGVGYHRPSGKTSIFARFCVVSAAGVFAAFRAEEDPDSELLTAYRPWRTMWPQPPTTRDFVAAARAVFATAVARRPGRSRDAAAPRRHGSQQDGS